MTVNETSNVLGAQVNQVMNQVSDPYGQDPQDGASDRDLANEIESGKKRKRKAKAQVIYCWSSN